MKNFRKLVSILLIFMMSMEFFCNPVTVQAASYPHITDMIDGEGKDIPYFPQMHLGDCGISSIAMIEAEALGYSNASKWYPVFYEKVFQANVESGKSPSFSISKAVSGYKSIKESNDSDTLENMYNELKKGNPILVYRTGNGKEHWSVVVAYNGSTSKLQKSGFVVYNTMRGVSVGDVQKTDLASWLSEATTWKHAYVRDSGIMSSVTSNVKTITLEDVYYPKNHKQGNTFSSTGLIISGSKITKIEVGVKTKSGTVKFSGTKKDLGVYYYGLMKFDGDMSFSGLSAGTYIYYVNVTNADGKTLNWSKEFTVSSSSMSFAKTTYGEIVPTKVALNKSSATLSKIGETVTLTATVTPSNATYTGVTWKSSDTSVAKVNSSGKVTAVGNGTATITATTESGARTATCKITVNIVPTGVKLDKTSATLTEIGQILTLKATVTPDEAVNKNVTWKSSNTEVAKVNKSGKVTAVGDGTATITVTTEEGSKTATCKITVQTNKKNGLVEENGIWYYYIDGKLMTDYTGLVEHYGAWFYVEKGVLNWNYTGLVSHYGDWFYVQGGQLNWGYTGLAEHANDWFYIEGGKLNWGYTGLVQHYDAWFYVQGGRLNWNYTGLATYNSEWFYIQNGQLNWGYNGLVEHAGAWYYVEGGRLNWGYTGLVMHYDAWFYVEGGVLNWNYTGLVLYNDVWFYVEGGQLNWGYTGLVQHYDAWFYVEGGVLNWNYTGLVLYNGTWFYVQGGQLNWGYTGTVYYNGVWWYVENGILVGRA